MPASFLQKSGTELGNMLMLYVECVFNYVTIVVLNLEEDPVLIFPTYAVSQIMQSSPTEISLYIGADSNGVLYKFGFSGALMATVWNDVLRTQCRHLQITTAQVNRRPYDKPLYEQLFNQINESIQRQKNRNR